MEDQVLHMNTPEDNIEPTIDNKLELLKGFLEVESSIKDHINSDFTKARLTDEQKEYITEMVFSGQRVTQEQKRMAETYEEDVWVPSKNEWGLQGLKENEIKEILKDSKRIFNNFIIKAQVFANTNRNVANNYLLRIIAGLEEEQNSASDELISIKEKIKDMNKQKEQ